MNDKLAWFHELCKYLFKKTFSNTVNNLEHEIAETVTDEINAISFCNHFLHQPEHRGWGVGEWPLIY